jgi:hypothetical protein
MVDLPKVVAMSRIRPRMLGLDGSFSEYVAFFNGVDIGTSKDVFSKFGEWIATRSGLGGWNIAWPLLVVREAGIEARPGADWHGFDAESNSIAVAKMFELLGEFLPGAAS